LTIAQSITVGESETEGGYLTSDDESTKLEQRQPKKGKSVRFKKRSDESGHIAGKVRTRFVSMDDSSFNE